jgi:hypothetical protein
LEGGLAPHLELTAMATLSRACETAEISSLPGVPPLPPNASAGRRWRFRRDLVIYLAHRRNGLSQRLLADVFDLPRSRIAAIIEKFEKFDGSGSPRADRPSSE